MFIDRNPLSESIQARAHGRVDMLLCCCKGLLALVAALTAGGTLQPIGLIVVACCVALVQLYAVVVHQPLFSRRWNCYTGAFALVFAWAAACTLLAHLRQRPDDQVPCTQCVVCLGPQPLHFIARSPCSVFPIARLVGRARAFCMLFDHQPSGVGCLALLFTLRLRPG